jgi:hypothetical protein
MIPAGGRNGSLEVGNRRFTFSGLGNERVQSVARAWALDGNQVSEIGGGIPDELGNFRIGDFHHGLPRKAGQKGSFAEKREAERVGEKFDRMPESTQDTGE